MKKGNEPDNSPLHKKAEIRSEENRGSGFLCKPFNKQQLISLIEEYL